MVSILGTTPVFLCLSLTLNLNRYSYPNPEDHGVEEARHRTVRGNATRIDTIVAAQEERAARIDAIVAEESCAEMEPSANSEDEDDVPIAQQLGILPRLQKSGDGLPLPTHPTPLTTSA